MTEPKIIDEVAQQSQHSAGLGIPGSPGFNLNKRLAEDTHNMDRFEDIKRREAEENIPENPMKKKPFIDFK